jgi:hypothetical protein
MIIKIGFNIQFEVAAPDWSHPHGRRPRRRRCRHDDKFRRREVEKVCRRDRRSEMIVMLSEAERIKHR